MVANVAMESGLKATYCVCSLSPQLSAALSSAEAPKVLDASWHMNRARDAKAEFRAAHLPGARFFDINSISDRTSSLPHMLPRSDEFESAVSDLGISSSNTVVVYTTGNCFSAARCWW